MLFKQQKKELALRKKPASRVRDGGNDSGPVQRPREGWGY